MSEHGDTGAEFRHQIGDALYALFIPYDEGDEQTVMYPVVKTSPAYVWVRHWIDAKFAREDRNLIRFRRDELERKGSARNRKERVTLYTRPMPGWPILLVENRRTNILEGTR